MFCINLQPIISYLTTMFLLVSHFHQFLKFITIQCLAQEVFLVLLYECLNHLQWHFKILYSGGAIDRFHFVYSFVILFISNYSKHPSKDMPLKSCTLAHYHFFITQHTSPYNRTGLIAVSQNSPLILIKQKYYWL